MLLPAITLLIATALPLPQVIYLEVAKSDLNDRFALDWEGKDISGDPVSLELVELIFRQHPIPSPALSPIRVNTSGEIKVGSNFYLVRLVLANVPLGRYVMTARAKSRTGEFSDEGNEIFLEVVDEKKPVVKKKPDVLKRLRFVDNP